jgi:predicted AlkP superfamily pyrophosphatase or phosphodiesterase
MLANPKDEAVRAKVGELLHTLAGDPAYGIDRVLTHDEILRARGYPDAAFFVAFKIGYEFAAGYLPPFAPNPENRGMHGYLPDRPEMRSSFFIIGPTVAAGRSLGEIDMRQIAPTLAKILDVPLGAAELGPLALN